MGCIPLSGRKKELQRYGGRPRGASAIPKLRIGAYAQDPRSAYAHTQSSSNTTLNAHDLSSYATSYTCTPEHSPTQLSLSQLPRVQPGDWVRYRDDGFPWKRGVVSAVCNGQVLVPVEPGGTPFEWECVIRVPKVEAGENVRFRDDGEREWRTGVAEKVHGAAVHVSGVLYDEVEPLLSASALASMTASVASKHSSPGRAAVVSGEPPPLSLMGGSPKTRKGVAYESPKAIKGVARAPPPSPYTEALHNWQPESTEASLDLHLTPELPESQPS